MKYIVVCVVFLSMITKINSQSEVGKNNIKETNISQTDFKNISELNNKNTPLRQDNKITESNG